MKVLPSILCYLSAFLMCVACTAPSENTDAAATTTTTASEESTLASSSASETTAQAQAEEIPAAQIPVAADFEEEASESIRADNYGSELEQLEAELAE